MTSWHKKTSGKIAIGVAAVAVLAWSGAWFYGARHVKKAIQETLADEQFAGHLDVHQDLKVGGYPFRLKAHADRASLVFGGAGGPTITVGPYAFWSNAWSPNTLQFSFEDLVGPEDAFRIKSAEGFLTWDFWHPERTLEKMREGESSIDFRGVMVQDLLEIATLSAAHKEKRSGGRNEEKHLLNATSIAVHSRGGVPFILDDVDFKAVLSWDANGSQKLPVSFEESQGVLALGAAAACFPAGFAENFAHHIIDDIEKRKTSLDADLKIKVQDFSLEAEARLDLKDRQPNVTAKISLKNVSALLKAVEAAEQETGAQLHQARQTADMILMPMGIKNGEDYKADLALQDGAFSVNGKTMVSGFKVNWDELFKSEGCNLSVAQVLQLLDLAHSEMIGGDPARAMTIYNMLAARDIWVADYYLGYMSYKGIGGTKDHAVAEEWVKKAVAHGLLLEDMKPSSEMKEYVEWAKKHVPASAHLPHAAVPAIGSAPIGAPAIQEMGAVEDAGSVFAHQELPENYAPKASE